MSTLKNEKMTNYRWWICSLLFFATTVNYMDRQVLSLTWKDFISPEFHWSDADYGTITAYFSIIYAVCMLFAGKFVDWLGTKKGYLWAIGIWSTGACLHAFCGIATSGILDGSWFVGFEGAKECIAHYIESKGVNPEALANATLAVSSVSVWLFLACRIVLAAGEAGNFPAAIKVTAEYFPKKDRAFATSIFNNGASVGALVAPLTIPFIAQACGWEMAFIVIGALGYVWMGFWIFAYKKPSENKRVNKAELVYINQDNEESEQPAGASDANEKKIGILKCLTFKQTWSFIVGKFMTDGVWWFFLFWTPAYISDVFGYSSSSTMGMTLIFVLYLITMLSIFGGYLPTYFVDKLGMNPYAGRMRAMLIFAFFPLLGIFAQPLGDSTLSAWLPIILIGILGAAHQSWSANIFSTTGDMFPKSAIATVTGIGGMAGGVGSFLINKCSGTLFTHAAGSFTLNGETYELSRKTIEGLTGAPLTEEAMHLNDMTQLMVTKVGELGGTMVNMPMEAMGFEGKPAGYMIIFCICAVAYLIGWVIMKALVPKYKPIVVD